MQIAFFVSFVLALVFVKMSQLLAVKFDIVDRPNTEVKTHTKITPYLGGLGIIAAFLAAFFIFNDQPLGVKHSVEISAFVCLFVLGVLDDKYGLSISSRWVVQIVLTIALILTGNILQLTPYYAFNFVFTMLGILMMINSMNILDILDGLSSGITVIILIAFAFMNYSIAQNSFYLFIIIIYIAALLGFMIYNFNPASIFMGDAGSIVLGGFLAVVFINTYNSAPDASFKFGSFLALSVPIFEVVYVSILRLLKKKNPMKGSKDHFALRLRIMGHGIKGAVVISYAVTGVTCLAVILCLGLPVNKLLLVTAATLMSFCTFGYILTKIKID